MRHRELLNKLKENSSGVTLENIINTKLPIIGVRIPVIRQIIKEYKNEEYFDFVRNDTFETNFIYLAINFLRLNDFNKQCSFILENADLLDTWAIPDFTMQYIKYPKKIDDALPLIDKLISNSNIFIIRYGYLFLFKYTQKENINIIFSKLKDSDEYYVQMVEAWLLQLAATKDFLQVYKFLETSNLSLTIKLKAIQKCVDSFRISGSDKEKLKLLRSKLKAK